MSEDTLILKDKKEKKEKKSSSKEHPAANGPVNDQPAETREHKLSLA